MARRTRRPTAVQRVGRFIKQKWWLLAAGAIALIGIFLVASFLGNVPLPEAAPGAQSSKLLSADGQVIATLHGEENRSIVPLSSISKTLQQAVIAAEDRLFYQHPGISVRGIMRAAFTNVRERGVSQGGSTITQQYVRNAFVNVGRERTIFRKLREATLAVKFERKYSKPKILEFYLNTVYFGRGAYGAEAAARTYFKKSAADLTLGEASYIAGLIRSPERFQIDRSKDAAVRVRNEVIGEMQDAGYATATQAAAAKSEDLNAAFKPGVSVEIDSPRAGYFVEYARRLLRTEFNLTDAEILAGGLTIQTTLDLRMQDAAEAAVSSTLNLPNDPEAALVAIDTQGHVRAMVGGRNVSDVKRARGCNWAANVGEKECAGRHAGSALKPVALAAFVDEGKSVKSSFPGPSKIVIDSARCRNKDGTSWEVSNFENASYGSMDVITATTRSVNTVYAQIMDKVVSPGKFIATAGKMGIQIPRSDSGCALTLGTTDVTPLEMARGFATFAGRGKRPDPLVITRVTAPDGKLLAERFPRTERALDENVADTVNYVLEENIKRGTGTGAKLGRPAAGKTGTTQSNRDALFAGYTPELTAVVWMGFPPDSTGNIPVMDKVHGREVTGGSFPATIWKKFMSEALRTIKGSDFATPELTGEVISPPPTPCPTQESDGDGQDGADGEAGRPGADASAGNSIVRPQVDRSNCIAKPKPSPSPTESVSPSFDPLATPTPSPSPTRTKDPVDVQIPPIGGNIGNGNSGDNGDDD